MRLLANVTVTEPTGGNNLSADKALNSTNGAAFTALGNIVITEGNSADFAVGNNQTLILTPFDGWRFNPGVGSVTYQGSRDTTAASIAVTASNLTVTFSVAGTGKNDILTISGVQVQPLIGEDAPLAGYIRRRSANPGTATIAGIIPDVTNFGLLNTIAGVARALAMHTQPSIAAVAGVPFDIQPEVKVVDQFGNIRQLDTTTVAVAARAAGTGNLQGTLTQTAVAGIVTYTDLWHPVNGVITIQFTATNLASARSDPIVIGPASADRLVFTTEPAAATAGAPFGVQPVLRTRDVFGSDSTAGLPGSQLVTVTLTSGTGELLGTATADIGTNAGNGVVTFTDLQINAAGSGKQLTATSPGLYDAVSSLFTVNPGAFAKLQLLVPGESAAPATATGKIGTPVAQSATVPFNITVNAVDAHWNLVPTVTHTVGLGSSDALATLPANAALVAGTKNLSVTLKTLGAATITATDITDGTKSPSTSPAITVNPGPAAKLGIQTQPSSTAVAGVPFTQQPAVRVEDAAGNLVSTDNGRVITAARSTGTGNLQGTLTTITVNGVATFANLSYNTAETVTLNFTASGLTNTVSSAIAVNVAAAGKLALATPPSSVATAGVAFSQQPVVRIEDAYGNLVNTDNSTVVTASRVAGSGALQGTLTATAVNGLATFTDLSHNVATNITVQFTASGLTNITSGTINVSPGAAARLTLQTPPSATATAGAAFAQQPVLRIEDQYGNLRSSDNATVVTASRATGSDPLQGSTSRTAAAGVVTFTNLAYNTAETISLDFAAGGLSGVTSGDIVVSAAAAKRLAIQTQPSSLATAGEVFGQQPVIRVEDQYGNLRSSDNTTVVTAVRAAGSGTLDGGDGGERGGGVWQSGAQPGERDYDSIHERGVEQRDVGSGGSEAGSVCGVAVAGARGNRRPSHPRRQNRNAIRANRVYDL